MTIRYEKKVSHVLYICIFLFKDRKFHMIIKTEYFNWEDTWNNNGIWVVSWDPFLMKKLLKMKFMGLWTVHGCTIHGRLGQQLQLEKKKRKLTLEKRICQLSQIQTAPKCPDQVTNPQNSSHINGKYLNLFWTKFLSKLIWRGEKLYKFIIYLFFFVNFETLTVDFYVPYVFNMHIKFRSNWILFTIRSINLFFIHSFKS